MKIKKILLFVFSVAALVLEALPYGVVLHFGNPEGEPWRMVYSYFSMIPFGYANFGPLIAGILTCIIVVLTIVGLFRFTRGLQNTIKYISLLAAAASFSPAILGMEVSVIAIAVTAFLVGIFSVCFVKTIPDTRKE